MANFEDAISTVLAHEGGWVCNPADPGGETNFGISMRFIKHEGISLKELQIPNCNRGCLKALSVETAKKIYKTRIWDRCQAQYINSYLVATKFFDACVNMGIQAATILLQQACCELEWPVDIDGRIGPTTLTMVNACKEQELVNELGRQMRIRYLSLISRNPKLAQFRNNWLHRAR